MPRCTAWLPALLAALVLMAPTMAPAAAQEAEHIGVIFVVHGGSDEQGVSNTFDTTLQFFQYDPNNVIFKSLIWNPAAWPGIVRSGDSQSYANAATQLKKYRFSVDRIGGSDPSPGLVLQQFDDMTRELRKLEGDLGVRFETDIAQWIGPQAQARYLAWPRYLYYPRVPNGAKLTYCGSDADGGPWKDCDPERYNVDGPAERLLAKGVDRILMIDMTVGGVRFWKTYDVVTMTRRVVADWNSRKGTQVPVHWLNDPTDLMQASYPKDPPNWTRSLGPPKADSIVALEGRPNPVIEDPLLVAMNVDGIVKSFKPAVAPRDTAVMFINHATRDGNETYDPKIDDTLVLDEQVKRELLRRYPDMRAENIIGSWMGIREPNPLIRTGGRVRTNLERTREMRGEDLGSAWLYESARQLPGGDHRYRYWDALELLRDQGARHIVVIFSQIVIDSVLNLVEVPNQIAKEIGWKTWLLAETRNPKTYPGIGHPFADYWGVWAETQCRIEGRPIDSRIASATDSQADSQADSPSDSRSADAAVASEPCCLTLGGCGTGQPYPPARQAPSDRPRQDTDPSLAFDIPAYGHLGYDPAKGAPNDAAPVQNQYRGTWAMWQPPNGDPRMGKLLAEEVARFMRTMPADPATGDGSSAAAASGR